MKAFVTMLATTTLSFIETAYAYEADITTGFHAGVHMMTGHSTGPWHACAGLLAYRLAVPRGSGYLKPREGGARRTSNSDVVGLAKKFHAGVKALIVYSGEVDHLTNACRPGHLLEGAPARCGHGRGRCCCAPWCAHYVD
ncbi:hypothetical protein VPH35_120789 [Triticum aestivum]